MAGEEDKEDSPMAAARLPLLAGLALALAACSSRADFRPVEAEPEVPSSLAGAYYEVTIGQRKLGDVKIWSDGSFEDDDDVERIHIGMRIRNDGEEPLRLVLEDTELELRTPEEEMFLVEEEVGAPPVVEIGPRETRRFDLFYPLPEELDADELSGVELIWALEGPGGRVGRSTPFMRELRGGRYRGYATPYHPYPYPFYPGASFGVGVGRSIYW